MMLKTTKLNVAVKNHLEDLKSRLKKEGIKSESDVVSYLIGIYTYRYKNMTLLEHDQAIQFVKDIKSQQIIKLE